MDHLTQTGDVIVRKVRNGYLLIAVPQTGQLLDYYVAPDIDTLPDALKLAVVSATTRT